MLYMLRLKPINLTASDCIQSQKMTTESISITINSVNLSIFIGNNYSNQLNGKKIFNGFYDYSFGNSQIKKKQN